METVTENKREKLEAKEGTEEKYLLFKLENELYGTPLLSVREVVEPITIKPVPNTPAHYAGIINLRGQIVGVLELKDLLGIQRQNKLDNVKNQMRAFIVFDTVAGPLAVKVDCIEEVSHIPEKSIERNPDVQARYPLQYLMGIGKTGDNLAHLIDFSKLLSAGELKQIRQVKKA